MKESRRKKGSLNEINDSNIASAQVGTRLGNSNIKAITTVRASRMLHCFCRGSINLLARLRHVMGRRAINILWRITGFLHERDRV